MPQTVPSANYGSPYCDYSAFTTDFDLSLLPASPESQVPPSPTNLSPYSYLYPCSPPPMFSTNFDEDGIMCDSLGFVDVKGKTTTDIKTEYDDDGDDGDDEPLQTPLKKTSGGVGSGGCCFFEENVNFNDKTNDKQYDGYYVKNDEKTIGRNELLIPTTVQTTTGNYYPLTIKQEPMSYGLEYGHHNNPTSPYAIKTETTIDLKEALKETNFTIKYESNQYATLRNLLKNPCTEESPPSPPHLPRPSPNPPEETTEVKRDHQLLRSVLRDTSFQKKFNIKSFDLTKVPSFDDSNLLHKDIKMEEDDDNNGSAKQQQQQQQQTTETNEIVEELTSEKIEPVFSLAIEQIRKDVDNTCNLLGISSGE